MLWRGEHDDGRFFWALEKSLGVWESPKIGIQGPELPAA